jgi:2,4-dienoyl-CoA reductase-like NADH-dependent reductase (Old Yellow Enzyme family)
MPLLTDPLTLPCGAVLRNRIAKSAMSEDLAEPGHVPGQALNTLYARWASSGAGLLISGNVMVDARHLGEPNNIVFEGRSPVLDALRAWAAAGQAEGTHFWPQINHPGRQTPLSRVPVAPSAIPLKLPGKLFATPRALESSEIEDIVGRYGRAAAISKEAGFSGVQIHGAHGYLVSQFLSPLSNQRDDAWGGDAERRRRFLVAIVRAMRAEVGPSFPIGVKLNSADFQRGGFTEDESMHVIGVLEAEGVDLLEISGGTYEKPAVTGAIRELRVSTLAREAYFLEYARIVRQKTNMPLLLTGGFRTRSGMVDALAGQRGSVDMVGLARPMALEPDLPRGLLDGSVLESRVQPKTTGIRSLDGLIEVSWYTYQLRRIARGQAPDPAVWPWTVLLRMAWQMLKQHRRQAAKPTAMQTAKQTTKQTTR